ncbi:TPA: hypothetical protein KI978_004702 [Escherichia coli]|nr:hypothetical protein [Escherichia coli]
MNQNKRSMLIGKRNENLKFINNWLRRVVFASVFLLTLGGCFGSRSANLTPTLAKVTHPAPKVRLCAGCQSLAVNILMICQYIFDTDTMLMGFNRKNRNVNDYSRTISGS